MKRLKDTSARKGHLLSSSLEGDIFIINWWSFIDIKVVDVQLDILISVYQVLFLTFFWKYECSILNKGVDI